MHGTPDFDVVEFVDYLRDKGNVFLVSCGVAVALAVMASLAMPKSYTAKASVVIDAPVGSDPRAILTLSSVYLESLKTYKSFAASDTLFAEAIARVGVSGSQASILKVSMPADTTVLEIRATLRDPRKAQALAQYVAEQTVERSNSSGARTAEETIGALRSKQQGALERLTRARRASDAGLASTPIAALENELRGGFDLEFRFEGDVARARTDLAEHPTQSAADATRARIASIEKQKADLTAELEKKGARLDANRSRREALEAEMRAAQTAYDDATARLDNTLSSPQLRGQRLRVIDRGTVPQQPSSPNLWLNTAVAFLASLIGAFAFLILRFGYVRLQREKSERVYSLV